VGNKGKGREAGSPRPRWWIILKWILNWMGGRGLYWSGRVKYERPNVVQATMRFPIPQNAESCFGSRTRRHLQQNSVPCLYLRSTQTWSCLVCKAVYPPYNSVCTKPHGVSSRKSVTQNLMLFHFSLAFPYSSIPLLSRWCTDVSVSSDTRIFVVLRQQLSAECRSFT
jgi:hypothetical protein